MGDTTSEWQANQSAPSGLKLVDSMLGQDSEGLGRFQSARETWEHVKEQGSSESLPPNI